jgi:hypothetical protein
MPPEGYHRRKEEEQKRRIDTIRRERFKSELGLLCISMNTYITNSKRGSMTPLAMEKLRMAWN